MDRSIPFCFRLHKLVSLMERSVEQVLKQQGVLPLADVRLLLALRFHGAASQNNIAKYHGLTEAAISRKLRGLLRSKYLVRTTNPTNRRERVLSLTPKGQREAERALKLIHQAYQPLSRALSVQQRRTLTSTLDAMMRAIGGRQLHTFTHQLKQHNERAYA